MLFIGKGHKTVGNGDHQKGEDKNTDHIDGGDDPKLFEDFTVGQDKGRKPRCRSEVRH